MTIITTAVIDVVVSREEEVEVAHVVVDVEDLATEVTQEVLDMAAEVIETAAVDSIEEVAVVEEVDLRHIAVAVVAMEGEDEAEVDIGPRPIPGQLKLAIIPLRNGITYHTGNSNV